MNYLKKITLAATVIVFCSGAFAVSSYAQYGGNGIYQNNNAYRRQQRQYQRIYRQQQRIQNRYYQNRYSANRFYQNGNYGYNRISPQEARRLQRQRQRLYNTTNRFYRDGYVSGKEQRKLQKRYDKYRRNVYRDRRDW